MLLDIPKRGNFVIVAKPRNEIAKNHEVDLESILISKISARAAIHALMLLDKISHNIRKNAVQFEIQNLIVMNYTNL